MATHMRGDSVRDFYAKTLALLGLGVLAGTGALVDYWPAGVRLPAVGPALLQPRPAGAFPVAELDDLDDLDTLEMPVAQRTASAAARPALTASLPSRLFLSLPVSASTHAMSTVSLELDPPETIGFTPVAMFASAGEEVSLSEPMMPETVEPIATLARLTVSESDGQSDDGGGLITGAFQRTGRSIVKTGVKTGASIRDAFRAVGGAVRKALPD